MSQTNIGKKNGNSRYLQIPRVSILNLKFYAKLIKYKEEIDICKHENVEINNPPPTCIFGWEATKLYASIKERGGCGL